MRPRLPVVACALVLCCVPRLHAQTASESPALIEWSAARPLTIKDFRGKVPARSTEASRSWVAIEASWECADGTGSWSARAVFDPARSWWKEINQNIWQGSDDPSLIGSRDDGGRSLLAHEQLHFNLTEVWARKIRELLKTLPAACKTPGGSHVFEKLVGDMERDWQAEQSRYDKETANGTDDRRQRAWTAKTADALRER